MDIGSRSFTYLAIPMRIMSFTIKLLMFAIFLLAIPIAFAAPSTMRLYRAIEIPATEHMINLTTTGVVMTDRHGTPFFEFDKPGRKTIIPLDQVPDHIINALIAAEDHHFYEHHGISPLGILRAAYLDIKTKQFLFGGSTITQQLAKNILLTPHKSLERKYLEALTAIKIEQNIGKDEILYLYFNLAYFGENAYGIEEAAKTYFNKSAAELSIAEGSLLIGLLPAPTKFSPVSGRSDLAEQRQKYVLRRLRKEGHISAREFEDAVGTFLTYNETPRFESSIAPHFALYVRQQLLAHFNEEFIVGSGLTVKTTLDLNWQNMAEEATRAHVKTIQNAGASNAASIAINPQTSEVLAMVGSINWHEPQFGKFNMAISPRQTGSAFKPIVYAAGLQTNVITPSTRLIDYPKTFGQDYRPENYDKKYRGSVLARYALGNSLNIPSVDAISQIGPAKVASLARSMGITSLNPAAGENLSLALGTEEVSLLELTSAYAIFANGGTYQKPVTILEIRDKYDNLVALPPRPSPQTVLSPQVSFLISSILSDNDTRAETFGNTLALSNPVAAKTGTTQDFRDAWTIGYTPQLAVGVWVGNNDNAAMRDLPGALGAAPLWRQLMEGYLAESPPSPLEPPVGVVAATIEVI